MAVSPPLRWGNRRSHEGVWFKTTLDASVREVLWDWTFRPQQRATSPSEYPMMLDGDDLNAMFLSDVVGQGLGSVAEVTQDWLFLQRTAATVNVNGASAIALAFLASASGAVQASGGSTVTLTFTVAASGQIGVSSTATVPLSFTITSAGQVGTSAGSTISETFTVTATGSTGVSSGQSVPLSFAVTSSGTVTAGVSSGASVPLSFAVTAAGSVAAGAVTGDAALPLSFAVIASGTVIVGTLYFSAVPQSFKRGRRYGTQDSWWLPQQLGVTVWRKDGVWYSQASPPPWATDGADRIYLGGRTYQITPAEQAELTAAGFGDGIYTS